jgi:hypothetical protein
MRNSIICKRRYLLQVWAVWKLVERKSVDLGQHVQDALSQV